MPESVRQTAWNSRDAVDQKGWGEKGTSAPQVTDQIGAPPWNRTKNLLIKRPFRRADGAPGHCIAADVSASRRRCWSGSGTAVTGAVETCAESSQGQLVTSFAPWSERPVRWAWPVCSRKCSTSRTRSGFSERRACAHAKAADDSRATMVPVAFAPCKFGVRTPPSGGTNCNVGARSGWCCCANDADIVLAIHRVGLKLAQPRSSRLSSRTSEP